MPLQCTFVIVGRVFYVALAVINLIAGSKKLLLFFSGIFFFVILKLRQSQKLTATKKKADTKEAKHAEGTREISRFLCPSLVPVPFVVAISNKSCQFFSGFCSDGMSE